MQFNYKLSRIHSNFAIIFYRIKEWDYSICAYAIFLNVWVLHSDFALIFLPKGNTIEIDIITSNSAQEVSV